MKLLSRVLVLALGLTVLSAYVPMARADELPLEQTAPGGGVTTTLQYGGQTFRVNSTAALKVKFEMLSPTEIRITLGLGEDGLPGKCSIYWVDFKKYIYTGIIPLTPTVEGDLDTEGGFVDR
jgi:hypothetical protein